MGQGNQPDWGKIAEKFDMWLPHIAPVGERLISALDLQAGQKVLDVASGTGEPALTVAQRFPGVNVTGTDAAEGMVAVAQAKVAPAGLNNLSFVTMPAEKLDFDDSAFDRVLCRFGAMLFEDSQQGLNEMCRVMAPGGKMALAVWNTPETMPIMNWSFQVFKGKLPEDLHPPVNKMTSLSGEGVLQNMLEQAGFRDISLSIETFSYTFDSFDEYWDAVEASDIFKQQFDALDEGVQNTIRDEVRDLASTFISDKGFVVPHEYILATASK